MASHLPVNHPLRPLYRVLVALIGAGIVVFGIVGYTRTRGTCRGYWDCAPTSPSRCCPC